MVNELIILTRACREDMLSKILENNVGYWPVTENARLLISREII